jgi:hypothetical protein
MPLVYKIATAAAEFEAIHHLNYRTFAEEIPQHPPHPRRRLVALLRRYAGSVE